MRQRSGNEGRRTLLFGPVVDACQHLTGLPTRDMPPNEILHRLFQYNGIRIPYQYFYRPKSFTPQRELILTVWRDMVDDALMSILARCDGHTRVVVYVKMDDCGLVSDVGATALLPRLPMLTSLDAVRCSRLSDATIIALTTKGIPQPTESEVPLAALKYGRCCLACILGRLLCS